MLTCSSQRLFGRPCPLCGLTRGIRALLGGDLEAARAWNVLALPVAVLVAAEIIYRTIILIVSRRHTIPPRLIRADLWLHTLLALAYLAYAAGFVLAQV